jgi:alkylhydroperoxidase/carboxymuconolactone decarboxylase family protein YurZ
MAVVKSQLAWSPLAGRTGRIIRAIPAIQEAVMADKKMKEFAGLFYREGALDPKTMQLVALAAMAAAGCTS